MRQSYFYEPSVFIYPLELEFCGKSGVGKGVLAAEMSSCATYLVYFIAWKVNLNKLSRNLEWALRITTNNCRIIFLAHTNTVILLEHIFFLLALWFWSKLKNNLNISPSANHLMLKHLLTIIFILTSGNNSIATIYRKIPKISLGAYIFQRPFWRGLFLEGLIFRGAFLRIAL